MLRPGLIYVLTGSVRNCPDFLPFCQNLNETIRTLATQRGTVAFAGHAAETTFVYEDNTIRCTYQDNAYGNDKYHLEVSNAFWSQIPVDVPRSLVLDDGWNLVYSFQDSPDRQVILQHIPGDWDKLIKRYREVNEA